MLVVFYMAMSSLYLFVCQCACMTYSGVSHYVTMYIILIALIHFLYCTNKNVNLTVVASGSLQSHQRGWAMPQIRHNYCSLV